MAEVRLGIIGLGNVGSGTLTILAENGPQIAEKLGFPLRVTAVCARSLANKTIPGALGEVFQTTDWREVVNHPEVDVVAELVRREGLSGLEEKALRKAQARESEG